MGQGGGQGVVGKGWGVRAVVRKEIWWVQPLAVAGEEEVGRESVLCCVSV